MPLNTIKKDPSPITSPSDGSITNTDQWNNLIDILNGNSTDKISSSGFFATNDPLLEKAFTVVVRKNGSNYEYIDGHTGALVSNSDFGALINTIDSTYTGGYLIHLKGNTVYSYSTTPITVNTNASKWVIFEGEGDSTILDYRGAGAAITFTGTTSSLMDCQVRHFQVRGGLSSDPILTGVIGIDDKNNGESVFYKNVKISKFDVGMMLENINSRWIDNPRIYLCNQGIVTKSGAVSEVNAIYINGGHISGITNEAIYFNHVAQDGITASNGNACAIRDIVIDTSQYGIRIGGGGFNISLKDLYFEGQSGTDIWLEGTSAKPLQNILLENIRGNPIGAGETSMITVDYAQRVMLNNIHAIGFTNMVVLNQDSQTNLEFTNPYLDGTTFLVNSNVDLTSAADRLIGTVKEQTRFGVIIASIAAGFGAGKVMTIGNNSVGNNLVGSTAVANTQNASVLMYNVPTLPGGRSNVPAVVCIGGLTQVSVNGSTTRGDTLVSDSSANNAVVNNAATRGSVIGVVTQGIATTGLCWAWITPSPKIAQLVDADIATGAAIAKSKISTSGTWVEADLPATTVFTDQSQTYTAGKKQTFASDATNSGMAFGGVSADPSSLIANDFWFRSDLGYLSYFDSTVVRRIPALGKANTWGATQTFAALGIVLAGAGAGLGTFTYANSATSGTLTFPATTDTIAVLGNLTDKTKLVSTIVYTDQANTYTAGMKQTFQASATTAGLNLATSAAPSSKATGDVWYTDGTGIEFYDSGGTARVLATTTNTQTFTSGTKTFIDSILKIGAVSATSKAMQFSFSGMTSNVILTVSSSQSTTQTITIPNISGADTFAVLGLAQTFTAGPSFTTSNITITDINIVLSVTTGTRIGTATGQKLAFWNAVPVAQQVLATGASHTVDDVITLLQTLGLCKQA